MKLLFDFLPIIVFFVVFQWRDIYAATVAIIIVMAVQILVQWLRERKVNNMLLVSGILVATFGGATLLLRDPIFIQWKPTIVYWLFAATFLGSRFIGARTLTERVMGQAIALPATMWQQLNLLWVANFAVLGTANLYVVYNFSEATWVNFKLFGTLGLTLLTAVGQAIWISARSPEHRQEEG
ncbi:septation protein A [Candidatus Rariloculus sp.]|uniref:septation protein A n=1 Tax=Candidatus Rariloculus sp. TaxID=3101265 RepID=UPI003D0F8E89